MTTPRDDVAGLSERLRELESAERAVASDMDMRPEDTANYAYAETARGAATAIDALQARVEELEEALTKERNISRGDWASQRDNDYLTIEKYEWEARALRAEQERAEEWKLRREAAALIVDLRSQLALAKQERDDAYERAAKVAENPGFIEAQDTDWDLGVNFAKGFIAAAIRQLAARHEKEKK